MPCCAVLCHAMLCYARLCFVNSWLCFGVPEWCCCALLCYAMLCNAMLRHAMPCYATLCYAMPCRAMLRYAMLRYATLCYAMLCCATLRRCSAARLGWLLTLRSRYATRRPRRSWSRMLSSTYLITHQRQTQTLLSCMPKSDHKCRTLATALALFCHFNATMAEL